eukprot:1183934-Prorocentrum_minimum.AAC.3
MAGTARHGGLVGHKGVAFGEDVLGDDPVHAPVTVHQLRDAEVNAQRDHGARLGLGVAVLHDEVAGVDVGVGHSLVDVAQEVHVVGAACVVAQLRQVVVEHKAVHDVLVRVLQQRGRQVLCKRGQVGRLVQRDLHLAVDGHLDGSAVQLRVTLGEVRITHRQQTAGHLHRVVHGGTHADAAVVKVAAVGHRGDTVHEVGSRRGQTHCADVHVHGDTEAGAVDGVVLGAGGVGDNEPGVVVALPGLLAVHARHLHPGREACEARAVRRETGSAVGELVHGLSVHILAGSVRDGLVDGGHLNLLLHAGVGQRGLGVGFTVDAVVEAPPGRCVATKGLAVGVGAGHEVQDLHSDDVAGLRAIHVDGARQDVHAIATA